MKDKKTEGKAGGLILEIGEAGKVLNMYSEQDGLWDFR